MQHRFWCSNAKPCPWSDVDFSTTFLLPFACQILPKTIAINPIIQLLDGLLLISWESGEISNQTWICCIYIKDCILWHIIKITLACSANINFIFFVILWCMVMTFWHRKITQIKYSSWFIVLFIFSAMVYSLSLSKYNFNACCTFRIK